MNFSDTAREILNDAFHQGYQSGKGGFSATDLSDHSGHLERLTAAHQAAVRGTRRVMLNDLQMTVSINKTPEQNEISVLNLITKWDDELQASQSEKGEE